MEAKCGLDFSTAGGGAVSHPSGLKGKGNEAEPGCRGGRVGWSERPRVEGRPRPGREAGAPPAGKPQPSWNWFRILIRDITPFSMPGETEELPEPGSWAPLQSPRRQDPRTEVNSPVHVHGLSLTGTPVPCGCSFHRPHGGGRGGSEDPHDLPKFPQVGRGRAGP